MEQYQALEARVQELVEDYISRNHAARRLCTVLDAAGVGWKPVVDHITLRTVAIDRCAEPLVHMGYDYAETIEYEDWFAKVYRAPGFPALFVDQAYPDSRGRTSLIPRWVEQFGDQTLHHMAVLVTDIEWAIARLGEQGIDFAGEIVGERGDRLRQIFTVPEQVDGSPFSVLELTERHAGYLGFSPPKANALMQSTIGVHPKT